MKFQTKNLGVGYPDRIFFDGLNIELESGENLALMGCNGAGKSTFLRTIAGRHPVKNGSFYIDGKKIAAENIGFLPQTSELNQSIGLSVYEFLCLCLKKRSDNREVIQNACDKLGLGEMLDVQISHLSGGQLNRLRIARLLIHEYKLILLDEPFAYLDAQSRILLLNLIKQWQADGKIVIVSLHDDDIAIHFDHFLTLDGNQAVWEKKLTQHHHECASNHIYDKNIEIPQTMIN